MSKKVYIAGKISGLEVADYMKRFGDVEESLANEGHIVLNPLRIVPQNLEYNDQIAICLRLVEIADFIYMLDNWRESRGARIEHVHAEILQKKITYQDITGVGR
jgi:hypothetical protein